MAERCAEGHSREPLSAPGRAGRPGWIPCLPGSPWLESAVQRGEPVFVLDVRHREEFEAVSIEGRGTLPGLNIPYFEMLEDLIGLARELGVNLISCDMSQGVMGIRDDELHAGLQHDGVGTFLGSALRSRAALFI
jgi:predicted peroxiredoxin